MKSFTRILAISLTLLVLMLARSLRSSAPRHTGSVEQTKTPGVAYGTLRVRLPGRTGRLHVVTIDPNLVEVKVLKASDYGLDVASVESIARKTGAQAVINGGFFDEYNKPLGLIVTDHKKRNPLRAVDWGVFLIRHGKAAILHTRDYRPGPESYALQCGPRLVVSGKVTSLKPRKSYRAA
ncbi:MAG: phosphodiester glycosidase family protein, partial [Armatimonadetes bacterium]|nr:phosphodiester glycosidase family protein [Armatimonadota bacterium]